MHASVGKSRRSPRRSDREAAPGAPRPRSAREHRAPSSETPDAGDQRRAFDDLYDRLLQAFGPQHWWPGETPTEVSVGAILTQNTAWTNVERAIARLKDAGVLDWRRLHEMSAPRLEECIRPSGTYRVKARRVKALARALVEQCDGRVETLAEWPLERARPWLLSVHGIGPETADAILLYAAGHPTFVVDAYTLRVLRRHGLVEDDAEHASVRDRLHEAYEIASGSLERRARRRPDWAKRFNEFHALFVALGKRHCRVRARCAGCPLEDLPHDESRGAR